VIHNPADKTHLLLASQEDEGHDYDMEAIWALHEYGIDINARNLYLMGEPQFQIGVGTYDEEEMAEATIGFVAANRFIKNLNAFQEIEGEDPVLVHMNTHGGSWTSGMAIYNAIKWSPLDVVALNYGEARSMSSIIPLAADHFVMMPDDTRYMFHMGTVSFEGTGTQFETYYQEWKKSNERMLRIYMEAMGRPHSKVNHWPYDAKRAWLVSQMQKHEDAYLDPEEAVHYGFAHEIFDGDWDRLVQQFDGDPE